LNAPGTLDSFLRGDENASGPMQDATPVKKWAADLMATIPLIRLAGRLELVVWVHQQEGSEELWP
jgi:hypothetical protein